MSTGGGSAERILAILDLFTEDRLDWTPDQLMARLGYSRPTLYRYLKTLKDTGFLTALPNAGFTLGPRVTELDYLMRKSDPLILHGTPVLDDLAQRFPGSAFLVRWYGQKLLCVASATSTPDQKSSYPRGRPMPLARGAISRAILAFLPKRQQLPLIQANLPDFAALGLGDTPDAITTALRRVRRDGVAVARGEVTPGVIGVAAPVFDAGRAPIAALCLTSDAHSTDAARLDAVKHAIRTGAAAITAALAEHREDTDEPKTRRRA